ncbi:MAG TPA: SUMF1/EgtB/PvdO family nonheme iron enzyme [Polyangiaceae bacterium]|jgi:formylglycine-generating enzyme required for sulfatase activity
MRNRARSLWLPVSVVALLLASAASAVTMDWTSVGEPGNACDPQSQGCFGAVSYSYNIGTYEVTNAQYAELLNAKAASDPLGLYNTRMGFPAASNYGGIARSGSSGSYTYSAIAGREDMPVNYVSFFDALRFANWLNNGQGNGDTETGAYTLLGGTALPSNYTTVARNAGAAIFLTSEDEWYKAAYYDPATAGYFDYPAGSNAQTTCAAPTATANRANCNNIAGDLTNGGSYTGSASPYGTFDQGGNVLEWNETVNFDNSRGIRGGDFFDPGSLGASDRSSLGPDREFGVLGFRVASIPEPSTGLLLMMGLLGLACRQRRHGLAA